MNYSGVGTSCSDSCGSGLRIVTYTATGLEAGSGLDFFVPIGTTLAADDYDVGFFAIAGSATLPQCEFPPGAGTNRTTSQFRVQVNIAPTAGDVWKFQIVKA